MSDEAPRVRPWLGGLLWLASNFVVMVFGQFLFPQALVEDPTRTRTPAGVAVGCAAFTALAVLHALYWRRVSRHVRATTQWDDGRAAPTAPFGPARSPVRPLLFGLGGAFVGLAVIIILVAIPALRSADSVDSPLLGLTYATFAVAPFGLGMAALGAATMRRSGLP